MTLVTPVIAKYYKEYRAQTVYEAVNFYFSSDLLAKEGEQKTYTYRNGANAISLTISNNSDDLRYTKTDIKYNVTITDLSGKSVTDTTNTVIKPVTGTLSGTAISKKTITFNNLKAGSYKVVATAIEPYSSSLGADFQIVTSNQNIDYAISDFQNSPDLYLTITTHDYQGNVQITIPNDVYPDSTDKLLKDFDTTVSTTFTVPFESNSEYTFRFFKKDINVVYAKNDFVILGR